MRVALLTDVAVLQDNCRCGIDHRVQSECLEFSVSWILLDTHRNLAENLPRAAWLPRTPSLLYIFQAPPSSDNPVIRVFGSFFRQVHPDNIHTLLAYCLMMYRLLRVGQSQML